MKTFLNFLDPTATDVHASGGKGANLANLTQNQFPVPGGQILTTIAYEAFIQQDASIRSFTSKFPPDSSDAFREHIHELRLRLEALPLPDEVMLALNREYQTTGSEQRFAVRSSSTLEDLAGSAFAGQHETFLNCRADEIPQAVKKCYISLWSERAVAYRRQRGFDQASAAMAVVIQTMVPSEIAGVAFSLNPVSGNLNEVVIDANYGLGESVVGGETEVDHFEIDKSTRDLTKSMIADKQIQIVGTKAGGVMEMKVKDSARRAACLDQRQLHQIVELIGNVEELLSFPQDIEWAFCEGQLQLLQSRPITAIPARWTREESAERFPNAISPMSWDLVEAGFHQSLRFSFNLMGLPAFDGKWFSSHGHYIYGDQNAVELYLNRSPFPLRSLEELPDLIPTLRERFRWVQELPTIWTRDLDHYLVRLGELNAQPLKDAAVPELWKYVQEISRVGADYFRPNIAMSITHSALFRMLHQLVQLALGPDRATPLFDRLLAFCETKTGMINRELFDLAVMVRETPGLESRLQDADAREALESDVLTAFPTFAARFTSFLRNHGHREIEFDAYQPTWIETPWIVLEHLKLILQSPLDVSPATKERALKIDMQQAELELMEALPDSLRFFFSELIRLTRLYTALDDLEHYQTTRLVPLLRKGLRELGSRLLNRGLLEDPMDVFFAHSTDMDHAVKINDPEEWRRLAARIRSEKRAYELHRKETPSWILGQAADDFREEDSAQGIPGSAGIAEGVVRQVTSVDDMAHFPKGAVLVARTTSPAWTPLFYSAAAVITESGGPLSHGAVTAREMHIPAVMCVRNALNLLPNGARVRVDGARGLVEILQPKDVESTKVEKAEACYA
jgi:phosphoenolpyruvate synthase/pyruvate phosphate dikinase